jgi:hypothetical protein
MSKRKRIAPKPQTDADKAKVFETLSTFYAQGRKDFIKAVSAVLSLPQLKDAKFGPADIISIMESCDKQSDAVGFGGLPKPSA